MTLGQLRVLLAACRAGSMTRAAEELGISQSAVSHALRALEQDLGIVLLDRGFDGVAPTAAGRTVLRHAEILLNQLDALQRDVAAARGRERGSLRVGAIPSANARVLPPLLRAFGRAHPQVRLTVMEGSDDEVVDWLRTGAADVGTVTRVAPGLATRPLATDRMLAILPTGHELSGRDGVPMTALARCPFIMSSGGCEPLITTLARDAGATLRCHYRVRDTASIIAMVAEGLGVSVVPELSLPAHTRGVRTVPLSPTAERTIHLALPAEPLPHASAIAALAEALAVRTPASASEE